MKSCTVKLILCFVLLAGTWTLGQAVEGNGAEPVADAAATPPTAAGVQPSPEAPPEDPTALVSVNWGQELVQGGITMVALGVLSVALVAFVIERLIVLRARRFVPERLASEVIALSGQGQSEKALQLCRQSSSTLGRVLAFLVEHRKGPPEQLVQAAADIGARELAEQEQRNTPFAVIAALGPLLGLLGTMIGMIEAFKLVEVFGDEGGASMLAGSISKALITTAVGLVLAIPAIGLFHLFKFRLHQIGLTLERETDRVLIAWFLKNPITPSATPPAPAKNDRFAAVKPVTTVG